MRYHAFATLMPLLAGLLLPSCVMREMTSTVAPSLPDRGTAMHGTVGRQMAAKSEREFPEDAARMRGYHGHRVVYPEPSHIPAPPYPWIYRPVAIDKDVWVAMVVDSEGRVQRAKCLELTDHFLARRIQRTVGTWNFQPGTVDGGQEEFLLCVVVKFRQQ